MRGYVRLYFRVFKLGRYNTSAMIFKTAMSRSAQPLSLLFYFMLIANILFASAIYYAENISPESNPSDEDNYGLPAAPFDSIPRAMYWCMARKNRIESRPRHVSSCLPSHTRI